MCANTETRREPQIAGAKKNIPADTTTHQGSLTGTSGKKLPSSSSRGGERVLSYRLTEPSKELQNLTKERV